MNKIEQKVLRLFLISRGLSETEVEIFISKTTLIERTIDSSGFYTTIKIFPFYTKLFINSQEWSDAVGYTNAGIEVGFVIFPPNELNNVVIEGFTYDQEYPENEIDYNVCSTASNKYNYVKILPIRQITDNILSNDKTQIINGLLSLFMNNIDKDLAIKYAKWAINSGDTDIKKTGIIGMGHIARVYGLENPQIFETEIQKIKELNNPDFNGLLSDVFDDFDIYIKNKEHDEY